jgi:hypothetical protein
LFKAPGYLLHRMLGQRDRRHVQHGRCNTTVVPVSAPRCHYPTPVYCPTIRAATPSSQDRVTNPVPVWDFVDRCCSWCTQVMS